MRSSKDTIVTDGTRVVSSSRAVSEEHNQLPATSCQKKADAFTFPAPRVSVAGGLLADDGKTSCSSMIDDLATSLDRSMLDANGRMAE